jgi:hypothetical protein
MVPDNGFQVFSHNCKIIGKLKNLSKGGLAYQYSPGADTKLESKMIDILASGPHRFHVSGIACKTVYDISELAADQTFRGAKIRVRGLEFAALTEQQKDKLNFLLENYATEPSENAR